MIGPNLSEWSLKRPSLIVFLMIIAVAAGALAFKKLGRDEDAAFTVRTMIVAAAWPGATVEETLSQVTERLERTLQETAPLRRRPKLHDGRPDHDLRGPGRDNVRRRHSRRLVPRAPEHRRHARLATCRRRWAFLQRRFRRHLRHHLWLHRRRLHVSRAARLCRECALQAPASSRRRQDRATRHAGRTDLHRVLDREAGGATTRLRDHRRYAPGAERVCARPASSRPTANASTFASPVLSTTRRTSRTSTSSPATASTG